MPHTEVIFTNRGFTALYCVVCSCCIMCHKHLISLVLYFAAAVLLKDEASTVSSASGGKSSSGGSKLTDCIFQFMLTFMTLCWTMGDWSHVRNIPSVEHFAHLFLVKYAKRKCVTEIKSNTGKLSLCTITTTSLQHKVRTFSVKLVKWVVCLLQTSEESM